MMRSVAQPRSQSERIDTIHTLRKLHLFCIYYIFISGVTIVDMLVNNLVTVVIVRHPQLRDDRSTLFMLSLTCLSWAIGYRRCQ